MCIGKARLCEADRLKSSGDVGRMFGIFGPLQKPLEQRDFEERCLHMFSRSACGCMQEYVPLDGGDGGDGGGCYRPLFLP
jgi:hypothetical protein